MTEAIEKISVGERIRNLRKEHGDSINTLAAKIGCTAGHIANIERGDRDIVSTEFLEKMAAEYGLKIKDILDGTRYKVDRIKAL